MTITISAPVSNMDRDVSPPNADRDSARRRDSADRQPGESGAAGVVSALTLEDFRRLGVRPDETRVTVIRQAAVRTSKSLAQRQLEMPSETTELQLSQVATSTYRLMDPRNRDDATARIHVGRILPNALRWAGQASFFSGQTDVEFEESVLLESADLTDREASCTDQQVSLLPQTGSELNVPWSRSLDSSDLLENRSLASVWLRRQFSRPIVVAASILVLGGTSLWLWNWQQQPVGSITRSSDDAARLQRPLLVDQPPVTDRATDRAKLMAPAPSESTPSVVSADDDAQGDPAEPAASATAAETVLKTVANAQQEFAEDMASEAEIIDQFPLDSQDALPEATQLAEADDSMLPSNTDAAIEPRIELDEFQVAADAVDVLAAETEIVFTEPLPVGTKPAIPDAEAVASARRQLIKQIPALGEPVSPANTGLLLGRLQESLAAVEGDAVDAWAIRVMMAEVEWLSGDRLRVQRRLMPLVQQFGADLNSLLAETFVGISEVVESDSLHASLLQSGLSLADWMLVNESLADCRMITTSMTRSANYLGDAEQFKCLEEFDVAVTSMERLRATTTPTVTAGIDQATPSTAGITGRYFCFMLRRWEQGLPWLANGSDRRLAQLCRDELAMPEDATVDARLGIAERWLATAERNRGREADSMRLHAVEILRAGRDPRRGVKQLMAERLVDEIIQAMPPFLQVVARTGADPAVADLTPTAATSTATPATAADERPSRLNGRIRPGGTDFGIALQYEPSTIIGNSLLEQLNTKLGDEFSGWSIELLGQFELEADGNVRLRVGQATDAMTQQVWLGEQLVTFEADRSTVVVPVQKGQQALRWVVTGSNFSSAFMAVQDAATGKEISIQPAYQPKSDDQPNSLTIKIQRRSP
jgi:hypothetical protein